MGPETLDRWIEKDLEIAPAQVEEAPENLISNSTPCTTSKKEKKLTGCLYLLKQTAKRRKTLEFLPDILEEEIRILLPF